MTKLQTVLALSPEQVAALPPPSIRIRQLEQENEKLLHENNELRRQLQMTGRRASMLDDIDRRGSLHSISSNDGYGRETKKRRMSDEDVYIVSGPSALPIWFAVNMLFGPACQSPRETPTPPSTEALAPPHQFPPINHSSYMSSSTPQTSSYNSQLLPSNGVHSFGYTSLPSVHTSATSSPTTYSASINFLQRPV